MWPPDGRRNEGTAEEHAIVLFDSLPVQAFLSWLGSFTAQPRRDTHGHQNVPSARFSRCAPGLSSLGLRNAKKETPSKRMVFLFWSGRRENRRSAACGRISEVVLRKCPNGRCPKGAGHWQTRRGQERRSAACGRISEVVLRKCPNGRCPKGAGHWQTRRGHS